MPTSPAVSRLQQELAAGVRPTVIFLTALVSLLLLATCANVAGLVLSRYAGRRRELSVQRALGASRRRLAQPLGIEALALAAVGGLIGSVVAFWAVQIVTAAAPTLSLGMTPTDLDVRFLATSLLVSVVAALTFSVGPIAAASRRGPADAMRSTTTSGQLVSAGAHTLVVCQVALTMILLAATGAALGVLTRMMRVELGFQGEDAVMFEVTPTRTRYRTGAEIRGFVDDVETRLRGLAGVTRVGWTSVPPMYEGVHSAARLGLAGRPAPDQPDLATLQSATAEYFPAMGIPLVAGRLFAPDENWSARPVAILSEGAARSIAANPTALIGQHLAALLDGTEPEIIGIVGDAWTHRVPPNTGTPNPTVYRPLRQQWSPGTIGVVVSVRGDRGAAIGSVRTALSEIDSSLPIYNVVPVNELRSRFLATERLTLAVTTALALVSLMLAAIGVHGLLAQVVSLRTREIGIRMALGAARTRMRASVVFSALRLTMYGVAVGVGTIAAGWRIAGAWIPQIEAPGLAATSVNAGVILAVATLAAWIPARRASAVDPVAVLKSE
jgi:predicted permease